MTALGLYRSSAVAALIAVFSLAADCPAVPVPIGGGVGFFGEDFRPPTGDVIADAIIPFTVRYDPGDDRRIDSPPNNGVFHPTLHNRVLRDPGSGALTFSYQFDAPRMPGSVVPIGREVTILTLRSFADFATDVQAMLFDAESVGIDRSPGDGAELTFSNPNDGLNSPPTVAVATDTTAFDSKGSLDLTLQDEFLVFDPALPDQELLTGLRTQVTLGGIFEPARAAMPVPLPPACYTGAAALLAAALMLRCFTMTS